MNKALKRNKCRYKETGMYLRMLDRRMRPIKDAYGRAAFMNNFDYFRRELVFAGHMGSFHVQRMLKHD